MILDEIVANSRIELEKRKRAEPVEKLEKMARELPLPLDFASALRGLPAIAVRRTGGRLRLIAEVKKASPSRGVIVERFNPVELASVYARSGASAISVLTEEKYFQGSLEYLKSIKNSVPGIPLLRKDFIFDEYQVYQSRAYLADALLLIVAILSPAGLKRLLTLSHKLGMQCLVEVHNDNEVKVAVDSGAGIIGINNRDLKTFLVDLDTTRRLRPLIPPDRIVVSESGIKTREDMQKMKQWGVDAVLIGEALVSAPDVAARLKELL